MSRKIIGVTVGTTLSPSAMERKLKPVKTVNGSPPDENGNVEVAGGGSSVTDEHINELIDAKLAGLDVVPSYTGKVEVE